MRIAIAQMNTRAGDFDATVRAMLAYGRRAEGLGADLLVFPAPVLTGAAPGALLEDEGYLDDLAQAFVALGEGLKVCALVPYVFALPSPDGTPGQVRVDAALVRDGMAMPLTLASMARHAAEGLAGSLMAGLAGEPHGDDDADEPGPAAPADMAALLAETLRPPCFDLGEADVGVAFSHEALELFASGDAEADVVCYLPFDGFNADDEASCLAPSVADGCYVDEMADANAWLVAANAAGAYDDVVYSGGSFVLAPWGELVAAAPSCAEDLLLAEFDVLTDGPLDEPAEAPSFDRARLTWDCAALAVRDATDKAGLAGVALVLDGTMASSALAALAVDAVGPLRVSALVCASDDAAARDARELARALRIRDVDELLPRDLERALELLGGDGDAPSLAAGLVEARLGSMARAGSLLALSCADKTQLAVGDEALAASRAACLAPFGDLWRSDVARLARYRNTVSACIPSACLSRLRLPSGLVPEGLGANDEQRLSALDAELLRHVERGAGLTELAGGSLGTEAAERLLRRVAGLERWRRTGPSYPYLSARPFAEVERPVCATWRDRVREEGAAPGFAGLVPETLDELAASSAVPASEAWEGLGLDGLERGDGRGGVAATMGALPPDAMRNGISEMLGYLQGLSAGNVLRDAAGSGGAQDKESPWPRGLFSDN